MRLDHLLSKEITKFLPPLSTFERVGLVAQLGKSARLISVRSEVQVLPSPPILRRKKAH